MEEENKSIFDKVAQVQPDLKAMEAIPKRTISEEDSDDPTEEHSNELIDEGFKPKVRSMSQAEKEELKGVKKELANGTVLTIKTVTITSPKTKTTINGVVMPIEPKLTTKSKAPFYESKLCVRFAEDNLVEYYPTIKIWVNNNKVSEDVSFDRSGNSKVAQIVRLALQKMSNRVFELEEVTINERQSLVVTEATKAAFEKFSRITSDEAILKFLVGKKVKVKTSKGIYDGKPWMRNDIVSFE